MIFTFNFKAATSAFSRNPFAELIRHANNYFLSSLAINGLAFISLPVMTRLLVPSDYGILNVFNSWQGILVSIITLNCHAALGRYYFESQDDFRDFFGASAIFIGFLLSLSLLLFVIWQEQLATLLGLPQKTIYFMVPLMFFAVLSSWFEQVYVAQKQSRLIMIRNILSSYVTFALIVICILFLEKDKYLGQIYATIISGLAFGLYYMWILKPYIKLSFKLKHIKYMLLFSVPLIPYSLSGVILAQFDRIMINSYTGASDAGLYSLAYNIGSMMTYALSALHLAWGPDYYKHMNEANYALLESDMDKILGLVMCAAMFTILFGKEVGMLLSKSNFHSSLDIVPVIVVGHVFYSFFTFQAWNIQYSKKNIYLSLVVLVSGIVNIALNAVYIPQYGYKAAAYTTMASYLFLLMISWVVNRYFLKIYCVPLSVYIMPTLLASPFFAAYYVITGMGISIWTAGALKVILLVLFTLTIFRKYLKMLFTYEPV